MQNYEKYFKIWRHFIFDLVFMPYFVQLQINRYLQNHYLFWTMRQIKYIYILILYIMWLPSFKSILPML